MKTLTVLFVLLFVSQAHAGMIGYITPGSNSAAGAIPKDEESPLWAEISPTTSSTTSAPQTIIEKQFVYIIQSPSENQISPLTQPTYPKTATVYISLDPQKKTDVQKQPEKQNCVWKVLTKMDVWMQKNLW